MKEYGRKKSCRAVGSRGRSEEDVNKFIWKRRVGVIVDGGKRKGLLWFEGESAHSKLSPVKFWGGT